MVLLYISHIFSFKKFQHFFLLYKLTYLTCIYQVLFMCQKLYRLFRFLHNTEVLWSRPMWPNGENQHDDYMNKECVQGGKRNIWYWFMLMGFFKNINSFDQNYHFLYKFIRSELFSLLRDKETKRQRDHLICPKSQWFEKTYSDWFNCCWCT